MTEAFILETMKLRGTVDAIELGRRAPELSGTEIIAEETKIPDWSKKAEYPVGVAVKDAGQVYTLLMAHRPADNPGMRPVELRAIYDLRHTKDPSKAKYWVASLGISGIWKIGECCTYINPEDGVEHVYRNLWDNNEYPPHTLNVESRWEDLGTVQEVQGK